jgi:hypothetical protein
MPGGNQRDAQSVGRISTELADVAWPGYMDNVRLERSKNMKQCVAVAPESKVMPLAPVYTK